MDLRQLQTLLVVAQVGSLKQAALRLRIVETALSRQIRMLEAEFGTPLFQRHGRGLTPTDAGRRLIEGARPILAALDALKAEMLAAKDGVAGQVAIGIPWLLLDVLTTRLATGFIPRHPAVNIRFVGGVSSQLRQMLLAGDVDLALMFDPPPTRELELVPLYSERLLLVGDRACGYRLDRPLPFSHLAGVPLAIADPDDPFRQKVEALARARGITLDVRFDVAALQPLRALAANGLAQVFASLHAVRSEVESGVLTAAPVQRPAIVRTLTLGLAQDRTRPVALERLAKAVRDEIAMLVAAGSFLTSDTPA